MVPAVINPFDTEADFSHRTVRQLIGGDFVRRQCLGAERPVGKGQENEREHGDEPYRYPEFAFVPCHRHPRTQS